jgi:hypothetical protein
VNSNEVLQKIADNILKKLNDNNCDPDVKLIVYMDDEFYQNLMEDAHQSHRQSKLTWDFCDDYTVMGYQVFRVIPQYTRKGTVRHPDYEIVIL